MSVLLILLKATLLLGGAWIAVRLLAWRRTSASLRHLVWTVTVLALLILPVLSVALPGWRVVPAVDASPDRTGSLPEREAEPGKEILSEKTPGASAPDWRLWAAGLWSLGAFGILTWLVAGHASVWRLVRRARPISDPLLANRRVSLVVSEEAPMAMTWGMLRPVVILPAEAVSWSPERRRAVLLHELAHVARRDALTQSLAQAACALYWFHPGVWAVARRMRFERELACDDRVLALGVSPREYASHLLELARAARPMRVFAPVAAAMASPSQLEIRLRAVLDGVRSHRTVPAAAVMGVVLGGLIFLGPVAALSLEVKTAWSCTAISGPEPYYPLMTGIFRDEEGNRMRHLFVPTGPERCIEGTFFLDGLNLADEGRDLIPAPGTEALVREKIGSQERILVTRGLAGGGIERIYTVNGQPEAFDASAREWLRTLVPEIVGRFEEIRK
ncbi:MAG TPA: M56 family metallopeptidase [Thermoanaerobaculia bacterium]|nr:M56 family metallopeptidase [Thermoanaerobaculia bacterium]